MKTILSKYMSDIAKLGHKKSPRSKDHYVKMQKLSVKSRKEKKLSTVDIA